MDYRYGEQQQDVADLASAILAKVATTERLDELDRAGEQFDRELWGDLASAGLVGIAVPEADGGSGAGFAELCVLIEEAAKAAAPLFLAETAAMAALPLSELGTREQRERLVGPFARGDLVVTSAASTVPGQGVPFVASDSAGRWVLHGAASHVALADVAERVLVTAVDQQDRAALFLVDPRDEGVTLTPQSSVDRRGRWHVALDGYLVAADDVVLAPGEVTPHLLSRLDGFGVAARCIQQLGTVETALTMTAAYVSERQQFGRPIGMFQAVSHKVADSFVDVQGQRLTAWRAAWLLDRGGLDEQALAIAGYWAADAPTRVLETAMQLHGGISVDLDFPLHRYFLAARQGSLALGGPGRRLRVLGDLMEVA